MHIRIDRDLPVPIPTQLQGQIEYGVSTGDFPPGSRLPSVREISMRLGISPVTVSSVYRALRAKGLVESRPGHGTFVRSDGELGDDVTDVVDNALRGTWRLAQRNGVSARDLIERLQHLVAHTTNTAALRILFVGVYPDVTRAYVADLRRHLGPHDEVTATTIDAIDADGRSLKGHDLLITFAHLVSDLERRAPSGVPVANVALVASERTRVALAEVDPLARMVLVSSLPEFVVTLRRAVERFASHVASVRTCVRGSDELRALLPDADVVVYATGSDDVLDGLPADVRAFEYRHVPDPVFIERTLIPAIERLRAAKTDTALAEEAP